MPACSRACRRWQTGAAMWSSNCGSGKLDGVMASPASSPPATTSRAAQFALALGIALLLGLLLFRGYGNSLGMRPTDAVAARFDVNSAERSDFEQIPGVGPKLAQAIVDHRGEKGRFHSLEQLRDVKGIGPETLEKLRPFVKWN